MGHIHAELMKQYAEDAANNDHPWRLWEKRVKNNNEWNDLSGNPVWHYDSEYRRKPKKIIPSEILKGIEIDESCKLDYAINIFDDVFNAESGNCILKLNAYFTSKEIAEKYKECFGKLLYARK